MVRSMWLPVTSGVASVCIGLTLWPSLASPADGLSLFGTAADARTQLDALLQRLPLLGRSGSGAFAGWSSPADHQDLGVANVSVHRVRYERGLEEDDASSPSDELHEAEDTLVRSLFGSAWAAAVRKARFTASGGGHAPSTSVVVTWEDHPLAASARPDAEAMCSAADGECTPSESSPTPKDKETGRLVLYEVQVWVNGWGLDAFWHPANRRLTTSDPFVVVDGLPHEQEELGVRVRMKVQTRARLLAGLWFLTSEVDGPWSNVVTLSPAAEPALATLFAFFASHQVLGGVLVLLVAISTLVILRLVATGRTGRARKGKRSKSETKLLTVSASSVVGDTDTDADVDEPRPPKSRVRSQLPPFQPKRRRVASVDLEQEVADLHQELADSEAEVRRLMLFRGYGIDELRENELEELEHELRRTLKLVQKRRRLQHFESLDETEEEEDEDERENDTVLGGSVGNGTLGTVIEEDAH